MMVRRKGVNPNNKGLCSSIPKQFYDLLQLFEDTGYCVSKSEIVRSALSDWFMKRLDLIYTLSHTIGQKSVILDEVHHERLQKIFEMIKRERASRGYAFDGMV